MTSTDGWVYGYGADRLHMPFNFTLLTTPWEAAAVQRSVEAVEAVVPDGGWPNFVLGEPRHAVARPSSRAGTCSDRSHVAAHPAGNPNAVYYGDELGMDDLDVSPAEMQDPWEIRVPGKGR